MTKSSVIVGYLRSPFTLARKGALAKVRPDEMAGQVIRLLIEKSGVTPDDVEDLQMGCAFPEGEQGFNVAKISAFAAGLPDSVAAATVNRFCGSSMEGIHIAAGKVALGAGDVFICAGVESMTRVPMGGFNPLPHPDLYQKRPQVYISMGLTAENVAQEYNISRREQEEFAVASQQKATAAQSSGKLKDEIVTIIDGNKRVNEDGCIRSDTSLKGLADLKTAFLDGGSVTAGTSSPLTDGVSAVMVTSENYADQHGLNKLARIKSIAVSGCKQRRWVWVQFFQRVRLLSGLVCRAPILIYSRLMRHFPRKR